MSGPRDSYERDLRRSARTLLTALTRDVPESERPVIAKVAGQMANELVAAFSATGEPVQKWAGGVPELQVALDMMFEILHEAAELLEGMRLLTGVDPQELLVSAALDDEAADELGPPENPGG